MPADGSVIAIDHGDKRTGFAISDPLRLSTRPLDVCEAPGQSDRLLDHIRGLMEDYEVTTFVVGFPFNMDGTVGPRAKVVDAFIDRLSEAFPGIRIVRHDERLTSHTADQLLRETGHFGKARKSRKDAWAAVVILEDWIRAGEP